MKRVRHLRPRHVRELSRGTPSIALPFPFYSDPLVYGRKVYCELNLQQEQHVRCDRHFCMVLTWIHVFRGHTLSGECHALDWERQSSKYLRVDAGVRRLIRMKFKAFIMMNVNLGCEADVLKALMKVQGFDEAFYVLGDYDIIVRVSANTIDELNQIVSHVRKIENVRSTATMITREL